MKAKLDKPAFKDFILKLRTTCQEFSDKAVTNVIQILKTGFNEKPNLENLKEVSELIDKWPAQSSLAVQLSLANRFSKLKGYTRQVNYFLYTKYVRLTGFPIGSTTGVKRTEIVVEWLHNSLAATPRISINLKGDDMINHGGAINNTQLWLRALLVCILGEKDKQLLRECAYIFGSERLGAYSQKGHSRLNSDRELYKMIVNLINNPKPAHFNIALYLQEARLKLLNHLEAIQGQLEENRIRANQAEVQVNDMTNQLKTAENLKLEHIERIKSLEKQIANEKQRYENLDKHWEDICSTELGKLKGSVRTSISHEVSEMRLCLEREEPNVEMALGRINNLMEYIENLKVAKHHD